jgi:NADPH-dependent curcumin reductase CurA
VEKLGADFCLNYKAASFEQDLIKSTEGYVDVFFGRLYLLHQSVRGRIADTNYWNPDNIAGNLLDLMLTRMKMYGRIALW